MPLDFSRLSAIRPYVYHLTARANLPLIEREGRLLCTRILLQQAHMEHLVNSRRLDHKKVRTPHGMVVIRDQKPLASGAIHFEANWTLERLIAHVNEHVFLWPGMASGPITAGRNHYTRYQSEKPVILRFSTAYLGSKEPMFCRYNSGAPRCSGGKYSPRGPDTYLPAARFSGTPSEVVEVVVKEVLQLPSIVEVGDEPTGPWRPLQREV